MIEIQSQQEFPDNMLLDFLDEDGRLSRMDEHVEYSTDFIVGGISRETCRTIFFAMPLEWRQGYAWDGNKKTGGFIATINSLSDITEYGESRDITFDDVEKADGNHRLRVWVPPKIMVTNSREILNAREEPPTPVVDGLVGKGESLLVSGAAGIGKSLMVNYLSHAMASQEDLWGQFKIPKPITSLIVQSEVEVYAQQDRLRKLLGGNPDLDSDRVFYFGSSCGSVCCTPGRLDDSNFQADIISAIYETSADILFIDPLISYNPSNENDNTEMRRVLDSFSNALKETGVTLVLTHHVSKKGETRGASAIRDWAANAIELELEATEGEEEIVGVTHDKARNFVKRKPFSLKRTKGLSFEFDESKAISKGDEKLKCVVEAIEAAGGSVEGQMNLAGKISEIGGGVRSRTAIKRIKWAVECGLIAETNDGSGKLMRYTVPGN